LGRNTAYVVSRLSKLWDGQSVPPSGVGPDRPSHRFGKRLQTCTGHHPRRVESSTAPRRKSEISLSGSRGGGWFIGYSD